MQGCNLAEEVFLLTGRLFCATSFVPSLVINREGRIIASNEQFVEFFCLRNESLIDSFLADVLYNGYIRDDHDRFKSPALESLYTNRSFNLVNRVVLGKPVAVFTTLILDSQGQALGILAGYFPKRLSPKLLFKLSKILRQAILLKGRVGNKDIYTMNHSELVGWYAFAIASRLGLKKQALNRVFLAGLLHDIGKIYLPDQVLNKDGPLNQDEFELIKKHSLASRDILGQYNYFKGILPAVTHHHEHYDGSGYPDGLKAEKIPLLSRILAVADAFEAITADRPYRKANCIALACEELKRNSGTQFDPVIVDTFLDLVGQHFHCLNSSCFPFCGTSVLR